MKTLTFSTDQVVAVMRAMEERIERVEARIGRQSDPGDLDYWNDQLDIAKQVLEMVQA